MSQITKTTLYSLSVLWFSEAALVTSLVALVGACAEVNGVLGARHTRDPLQPNFTSGVSAALEATSHNHAALSEECVIIIARGGPHQSHVYNKYS